MVLSKTAEMISPRDENGQIREQFYLWEGKLHGLYLNFHANGALKIKANFYLGKLHGFMRCYDSQGELLQKARYQQGELHGRFLCYQHGKPSLFGQYVHGQLDEKSLKPIVAEN